MTLHNRNYNPAACPAQIIVWIIRERLNLPRHLAASLGNQPRGTLIAHVNPQPAQRDAEAVTQADQEIDVRDTPDPPCDGAAQFEAPEIDHRLPLADLPQASGVFVMERRDLAAAQPRLDGFGDITSLLLGCRC